MPRWVYPLASLFLLFVIFNDPTGAGNMAAAFADFLGQLLSALGEFFSGLFGNSSGSGSTTTGGGSDLTIHPQVTVPSAPTTDVYVHGHHHGVTGG